jgi:hypothetical protein
MRSADAAGSAEIYEVAASGLPPGLAIGNFSVAVGIRISVSPMTSHKITAALKDAADETQQA